jgi:hypothetical protein
MTDQMQPSLWEATPAPGVRSSVMKNAMCSPAARAKLKCSKDEYKANPLTSEVSSLTSLATCETNSRGFDRHHASQTQRQAQDTLGTAQQVTIWRSTSPSAESKRTDTASWQACGMVHGAVAEKLI